MGSTWFLLGDVNASRAKPDVEYGPESFFFSFDLLLPLIARLAI